LFRNDSAERTQCTLLLKLSDLLQMLGDVLVPHHCEELAGKEEATAHLEALDGDAAGRRRPWFRGQQISAGLNNRMHREWRMRQQHANVFDEL
jgi:hypothetical protein